MIRDYQSWFVKGRIILDGIIISKEVIHHCSRSRHDGYLLKLDFEKVCDNISWEYLLEVLALQGFGQRW